MAQPYCTPYNTLNYVSLLLNSDMFTFSSTVRGVTKTARRGRPPTLQGRAGKKRRQEDISTQVQEGLLLHISENRDALLEAGKALNQKLARQKRKPKRLTEGGSSQELSPRSGQVI